MDLIKKPRLFFPIILLGIFLNYFFKIDKEIKKFRRKNVY